MILWATVAAAAAASSQQAKIPLLRTYKCKSKRNVARLQEIEFVGQILDKMQLFCHFLEMYLTRNSLEIVVFARGLPERVQSRNATEHNLSYFKHTMINFMPSFLLHSAVLD